MYIIYRATWNGCAFYFVQTLIFIRVVPELRLLDHVDQLLHNRRRGVQTRRQLLVVVPTEAQKSLLVFVQKSFGEFELRAKKAKRLSFMNDFNCGIIFRLYFL